MEIEFVKSHVHRGKRYAPGTVLDVSANDLVKLVGRGVAKKVASRKPKPAPVVQPEESTDPTIGDTDGPATDE